MSSEMKSSMSCELITRKEAIKRAALLMGGVFVGARAILGAENSPQKNTVHFSDDQIALLDEITDIIIPAGDTPGAKSVGSGAFIVMMVKDCYTQTEAEVFTSGLNAFSKVCLKLKGKDFLACSLAERIDLVKYVDQEAKHQKAHAKLNATPHYFSMIKELTILSYYTSEIGASHELRYIEVPGSFNGSYPYKKGDRAWST